MIYEYVWSAVMKSFLDDESSAPSFNVDALTFMEEIFVGRTSGHGRFGVV